VRVRRAAAFVTCLAVVAASTAVCAPANQDSAPATLQSSIQHVVVIYQENWSFDGLYGTFPGANNLDAASATIPQIDKLTGAALTSLPQPLDGSGKPDPDFPAGLPVAPYAMSKFITPSKLTGDLVHRFYQQQSQIDGGKMDKFVTWSDNPGLVLSYFDATNLPEGKLAQQYVLADNFFHSAFGGSFLNHVWLVCACTPTFPNAPGNTIAKLDASGQLALDSNGKIVQDGIVTPDGYAVNTVFSVNTPHPANAPAAKLLPSQSDPTIGDRLSAAGVSWKWYAGGWNDALGGNPDRLFQFHHQPFVYFKNYADGTAAKAQHLQDEASFLADAKAGTLPAVSFVKPLGTDNEHPGYAALAAGQQHVADLVAAVQASTAWPTTAIVITYDENGGRWDHVPPPGPFDRWGPGTRVPTIIISPWAKRGFVDHTRYETVSILAFIERRWGLAPLATRDAKADPLSNAFTFAFGPPRR